MEKEIGVTEWEEVSPNSWKYEKEGDSIEGILVKKEAEQGTYNSMVYIIERPKDQGMIMIWGTTVLDDRMKLVQAGEYVKIEYKGTERNKRNKEVKIFKVFKAKGLIPVQNASSPN